MSAVSRETVRVLQGPAVEEPSGWRPGGVGGEERGSRSVLLFCNCPGEHNHRHEIAAPGKWAGASGRREPGKVLERWVAASPAQWTRQGACNRVGAQAAPWTSHPRLGGGGAGFGILEAPRATLHCSEMRKELLSYREIKGVISVTRCRRKGVRTMNGGAHMSSEAGRQGGGGDGTWGGADT